MTDSQDMCDALTSLGLHTFQDGAVLASINNFSCVDDMLVVETVTDATFFGAPVTLDLPLHFVGFSHGGQPLETEYRLIADNVRQAAEAS